jgi:hypothetical protein
MKTYTVQVITLRSYSIEVSAPDREEACDTIYRLGSLADLDALAEPDWIDLDFVDVIDEQEEDDNDRA